MHHADTLSITANHVYADDSIAASHNASDYFANSSRVT